MYIKGFRVKFASYRKFGSKWIRGSVPILCPDDKIQTFTCPQFCAFKHFLVVFALVPNTAAPIGGIFEIGT